MFKNGGSTLDWILKRNFKDAFREWHGPEANSTLFVSDCAQFLETNPGVQVISSHHLRFPIDLTRDDLVPLVILRHPIDRIASVFEHERRKFGIHRNNPKFESLSKWLRIAVANEPYNVCDSQTVFIADGATYYDPPDKTALVRAKETMESLPFVGVVNRFEASMLVLERMVQKRRPSFDAAFFPQNVSIGRHSTLEHRLAAIENDLEPDIWNCIWNNNRYDLELFEAANKRLDETLLGIKESSSQLTNLRCRCLALR